MPYLTSPMDPEIKIWTWFSLLIPKSLSRLATGQVSYFLANMAFFRWLPLDSHFFRSQLGKFLLMSEKTLFSACVSCSSRCSPTQYQQMIANEGFWSSSLEKNFPTSLMGGEVEILSNFNPWIPLMSGFARCFLGVFFHDVSFDLLGGVSQQNWKPPKIHKIHWTLFLGGSNRETRETNSRPMF